MTLKFLCVTLLLAWTTASKAAPIVWSGFEHTFSKADGVDPFLPVGHDPIAPSVSLSRLITGGGLLNVVSESSYDRPLSPSGTRWAFPFANPTHVVAAWNHAQLTFLPWADALGSNGAGGPPATIGQSVVVHLMAEDIYLDWRLTGWTVRVGGGFSYERANGPELGDYNADGMITSADYQAWIEAFGSSATLPDGNENGTVDAADYTIWRDLLDAPAAAKAVPEPPVVLLLAIALGITSLQRRWTDSKATAAISVSRCS